MNPLVLLPRELWRARNMALRYIPARRRTFGLRCSVSCRPLVSVFHLWIWTCSHWSRSRSRCANKNCGNVEPRMFNVKREPLCHAPGGASLPGRERGYILSSPLDSASHKLEDSYAALPGTTGSRLDSTSLYAGFSSVPHVHGNPDGTWHQRVP